jgi:hypothetical protein
MEAIIAAATELAMSGDARALFACRFRRISIQSLNARMRMCLCKVLDHVSEVFAGMLILVLTNYSVQLCVALARIYRERSPRAQSHHYPSIALPLPAQHLRLSPCISAIAPRLRVAVRRRTCLACSRSWP